MIYMKKFNIISCFNNNRVIGNNNDLIYKIKEDLQRFKSITKNNVVIMGRNTFESPITSFEDAYTVKFFIWKDISGIMSLCEPYVIKR